MLGEAELGFLCRTALLVAEDAVRAAAGAFLSPAILAGGAPDDFFGVDASVAAAGGGNVVGLRRCCLMAAVVRVFPAVGLRAIGG